MESMEYQQSEIYFAAKKYDKSLKQVESLLQLLKLSQMNSPAYVYV